MFKTTALQLGNRKIQIIHHEMELLLHLVLSKLWAFFLHLNKHKIKAPKGMWEAPKASHIQIKNMYFNKARLILICLFIQSLLFYKILCSQGVTKNEALVKTYFLQDIRVKKIWSSFWFEFIGFTVIPVNGLETCWHAIWWLILMLQHAKKAIIIRRRQQSQIWK